MDPVAQADRQPARKLVYLEVVTTALRRLGLSEESIKRGIFQGCGDGSLPYSIAGEDPPPGFWRNPATASFNASDISNVLVGGAGDDAGIYTFTLRDVMLDWEHVVAKYPALRGTRPPGLGIIEISFAAPLMRWFETLMGWLGAPWRKPAPPAQEEPAAPESVREEPVAPASAQEEPAAPAKRTREDVDDWLKERLRQRPLPRKRRQKAEWFRVAHEQMKSDFEPVPFGDSDSLRRYFDKAVQQKKFEPGQTRPATRPA